MVEGLGMMGDCDCNRTRTTSKGVTTRDCQLETAQAVIFVLPRREVTRLPIVAESIF